MKLKKENIIFLKQNKSTSFVSYIERSIFVSSFISILIVSAIIAILFRFFSPNSINDIDLIMFDKSDLSKNITDLIISRNQHGIDALNIENRAAKGLDYSYLSKGDISDALKLLNAYYEKCEVKYKHILCSRSKAHYLVSYIKIKTKTFSGLYIQSIKSSPSNLAETLVITLLISLLFTVLIFINLKFFLKPKISKLLKSSIDAITKNKDSSKHREIDSIKEFSEIARIVSKFTKLELINKSQNDIIQHAEQIRHDISSPLATLQLFFLSIKKKLPENERLFGEDSLRRAQDIINSLPSEKYSINKNATSKPEIIEPIIHRISSEKRMLYQNSKTVSVKHLFKNKKFGIFANIIASNLSRAISNLVNNAYNARNPNALDTTITISCELSNNLIEIIISDNGLGFDPIINFQEITLEFIKLHGNSNGMGLSQALSFVEESKGNIFISSQPNIGTEVILKIPSCYQEKWFKNTLFIPRNHDIVCIDDDNSIHDIWIKKIRRNVNIVHFYNSEEFKIWADNNNNLHNYTFLFDYELLGSTQTGLQLIKHYNISKKSTLVTNQYYRESIQKECTLIDLKIIPKDCAPFLPIFYEKIRKSKNLILNVRGIYIDDNNSFLKDLKSLAKNLNTPIKTFSSVNLFLEKCHLYPLDTPIYIDSYLNDGIRGEEESLLIHQHGFCSIHLSSGRSKDSIQLPPWIKSSVNKGYPIIQYN